MIRIVGRDVRIVGGYRIWSPSTSVLWVHVVYGGDAVLMSVRIRRGLAVKR